MTRVRQALVKPEPVTLRMSVRSKGVLHREAALGVTGSAAFVSCFKIPKDLLLYPRL